MNMVFQETFTMSYFRPRMEFVPFASAPNGQRNEFISPSIMIMSQDASEDYCVGVVIEDWDCFKTPLSLC